MKRSILILLFVLSFIGIGLNVSSAIATDDPRGGVHERKRFRADLQTTSMLVEPPPGRCNDQAGHAQVVGLLQVVGAGDATFLGPVIVEQSHCVRADGSFFGGVFKLTNADGQTIQGRYFGQLVPTFNSIFPPPAPEGTLAHQRERLHQRRQRRRHHERLCRPSLRARAGHHQPVHWGRDHFSRPAHRDRLRAGAVEHPKTEAAIKSAFV